MTHYSFNLNISKLSHWASSIAGSIIEQGIENPVLCYMGMSGIGAATAIALKIHEKGKYCDMIYVRKDTEKSHGNLIEKSDLDSEKKYSLIFVDDFINSGDTFIKVLDKVQWLDHPIFDKVLVALQTHKFANGNPLLSVEEVEEYLKYEDYNSYEVNKMLECVNKLIKN